jgi:putrescine transport system substrate-binding protein
MRALTLFASAGLVVASPAIAQQRVVNVDNWSDYIDPKVLEDFTKETGIKVVYDTYDSNEALETKLLAGKTDYDVVVPSATFLQRQIKAGVYQKLDKSKLTNIGGLWPEVMARLAAYDPGNQYAVNYMWFTTGIAFDVEKAKQRMGGKPIESWDTIFKPENLRKFSDCGVYMLDSPEDNFTAALKFIGANPDSKKPEDIHRAADAVIRVKPFVKKFHSSEYINALANGDICLAVGWAGDSFQARNRAKEAANGVDINYVIPKEGALMSLDSLAIPKDAPHVAEAYAFIDYLLRPEVAARNTATTNFANGVLASKRYVDKDILDNPSIYPKDDTLRGLYVVSANDQATQKIVTREWTRVKTGR